MLIGGNAVRTVLDLEVSLIVVARSGRERLQLLPGDPLHPAADLDAELHRHSGDLVLVEREHHKRPPDRLIQERRPQAQHQANRRAEPAGPPQIPHLGRDLAGPRLVRLIGSGRWDRREAIEVRFGQPHKLPPGDRRRSIRGVIDVQPDKLEMLTITAGRVAREIERDRWQVKVIKRPPGCGIG